MKAISRQRLVRRPFPWSTLITLVTGLSLGMGTVGGVWWFVSHSPESVTLYWVTTETGQLVPEQRSLWIHNNDQSLEASLQALFAGSPAGVWQTSIPAETKVLGVRIESGDIFVNLSPEFREDATPLHGVTRLRQVVYTATQDNPTGRVWLTIEGQSLIQIGAMVVPQPLTRETVVAIVIPALPSDPL